MIRTYPQQSKVVSSPVYLDPNIPPAPLERGSLVGSLAYIRRSYYELHWTGFKSLVDCYVYRVSSALVPLLPFAIFPIFGPKVLTSLSRPQPIQP